MKILSTQFIAASVNPQPWKIALCVNRQGVIPRTDANRKRLAGMSEDGLHFTEKSYQIWADGLKPILHEILGLPAVEDRAPPTTGSPAVPR